MENLAGTEELAAGGGYSRLANYGVEDMTNGGAGAKAEGFLDRYFGLKSGGTDVHDVWNHESGRIRTFGHVDGPLTPASYAEAVKSGHAYVTYGPLIDAFPVPVGRSAHPDELAALIGFLLSQDARFICGSVIFCDGGTDAQIRPNDFPTPFPR